ncbi:MotA/TolQ/ExbB proton channel family protein [Sphingomonas sp. RHCKR47]|uniref:motility protein A n=1 Tax=Sphingomonas citricola TaxID=2862498 RepID=UPI001CA5E647|nr:MotA/TolQ/ExbB proton channel family protein [Sphingomonas citricola]MBW6524068.1 MotA/TolQ/ExbB proton channel family protein [Sphingomonas citricola]
MTPGIFLDPVAIAIVFGGTLLATALRTPAPELVRAVAALRVLARRRFSATPLLEQIVAQDRIARRHGAMALDRSVIADPDVAAGIAGVVDGATPEAIAADLEARRRARIERHLGAADCWAAAAEAAPAMGMVGTLVGLVVMFTRMSDPTAIGGAMAVALLATLYGALVANLIAMPIAARLRAAARVEATERQRLVAPLIALAVREAPRMTGVSTLRATAA